MNDQQTKNIDKAQDAGSAVERLVSWLLRTIGNNSKKFVFTFMAICAAFLYAIFMDGAEALGIEHFMSTKVIDMEINHLVILIIVTSWFWKKD